MSEDKRRSAIDYYSWDHTLSDAECDFLIADCQQAGFGDARINANVGDSEHKTRKTNVAWVDRSKLIYRAMVNLMLEANQSFFRYNITDSELVQFAEYKKGDHYVWHKDETWSNKEKVRKLTVMVLLSDPKWFKGGELELFNGNMGIVKPFKKRGQMVCINCYDWHRVTPVTEGVRYSLVQWSNGPRFV